MRLCAFTGGGPLDGQFLTVEDDRHDFYGAGEPPRVAYSAAWQPSMNAVIDRVRYERREFYVDDPERGMGFRFFEFEMAR